MRETELYRPVKSYLEKQGYIVKSEVRACDVVAVRHDEPPVIVELKTSFSLQLLCQGVDRLAMTDSVYVAIPRPRRGVPAAAVKLCRRIGIGLVVVGTRGQVEVLADPLPYVPRRNHQRKRLLLREFHIRQGDPNIGGSTGSKIVTVYRQDAMRCAIFLSANGPSRVRDIRSMAGVDRASNILRDNHYNWFAREARGIYGLTEVGKQAAIDQAIPTRP